jgi:hypothetical protein
MKVCRFRCAAAAQSPRTAPGYKRTSVAHADQVTSTTSAPSAFRPGLAPSLTVPSAHRINQISARRLIDLDHGLAIAKFQVPQRVDDFARLHIGVKVIRTTGVIRLAPRVILFPMKPFSIPRDRHELVVAPFARLSLSTLV